MQKKKKKKKIFFYPCWPILRKVQIFKKSVSQSTQNVRKRIEIQKKKFYPFDWIRASLVAQSTTLPTPCHSQGPKECPCGR